MSGSHLNLFALALLGGFLAGYLELCHGQVAEDEDYYMQELLSREHYHQAPGAEEKAQTTAKKGAKGKAPSSRQTDKATPEAKTGTVNPSLFYSSQQEWLVIFSKLVYSFTTVKTI